MEFLRTTKIIALIAVATTILAACQSNMQIESSFDETYLKNSVDLTFSSPNFSALHAPPLMSGFAYVETYEKTSFCSEEASQMIGKVTITRSNL